MGKPSITKEFLMNEQQQSIPYTFGSYLKGQLEIETKNIDKNILVLNKVQKFLEFIISNKLVNAIQSALENLGQINKIWRNFGTDKQFDIKISKCTYTYQIKKIINNFQEYFQNLWIIFKLFRLGSKEGQPRAEQLNNTKFSHFQQLKYLLKLLVQILQEFIEETEDIKNNHRNQITEREQYNNEMLEKYKNLLQQIEKILQTFSSKVNFQFLDSLKKKINSLPTPKEINFITQAQKMIQLVEDCQKQVKKNEIELFQNYDSNKFFEEFTNCLNQCYESMNDKIYNTQRKFSFQKKCEIEAVQQLSEFDNIKKQFYEIQLINRTQNSRFNILQLKLQLINLKESFQILLQNFQSDESDGFQKLDQLINFDKFLLDAIKILLKLFSDAM